MSDHSFTDYYELLQVSPRVDQQTLGSVFRHLAKRFHPDNPATGNPDRFRQLRDAFNVLSDPESRASYDVRYERARGEQWRIFDQEAVDSDVEGDRRVRLAALSLLYSARRNDPDNPGIGIVDMERVLGCPEQHMNFHTWYMKDNGWIERLPDGMWAITSAGVDKILDLGGPVNGRALRLPAARNPEHGSPPGHRPGDLRPHRSPDYASRR